MPGIIFVSLQLANLLADLAEFLSGSGPLSNLDPRKVSAALLKRMYHKTLVKHRYTIDDERNFKIHLVP